MPRYSLPLAIRVCGQEEALGACEGRLQLRQALWCPWGQLPLHCKVLLGLYAVILAGEVPDVAVAGKHLARPEALRELSCSLLTKLTL